MYRSNMNSSKSIWFEFIPFPFLFGSLKRLCGTDQLHTIKFEEDPLYRRNVLENYNSNTQSSLYQDPFPKYINAFSGYYHQESGGQHFMVLLNSSWLN